MLTIIKTLLQGENVILPKTRSIAVTMDDGTNLEYAIKHVSTDNVKLTSSAGSGFGILEGSNLSYALTTIANQMNTSNVLAAAEVVENE